MLYWRAEQRAHGDAPAQQAQINVDDEWLEADFDFAEQNPIGDAPFDLRRNSELEIGRWSY